MNGRREAQSLAWLPPDLWRTQLKASLLLPVWRVQAWIRRHPFLFTAAGIAVVAVTFYAAARGRGACTWHAVQMPGRPHMTESCQH